MVPSYIETFKKMIVLNTKIFAEVTAKNINAMLQIEGRPRPVIFSEEGVVSKNNVYVSIMFTGMVYGEFILAFDSELVSKMTGKSFGGLTDDKKAELNLEVSEIFSEILNITVGETVRGLTEVYQKITVTAPRVHIGQVKYPKVKTGKSTVQTKVGEIECFLYVDQMKLDIAESYKTALISVVNSNKALRAAYEQLQEQQVRLIQAEKLAALGVMATGVAQEINTPLATILLSESKMKSSLSEENFNREKFSDMLSENEKTIAKISKITQSLQAYALSNTSPEADFRSVSINSIIDEALLFCEDRLSKNGVQLAPFRFPDTVQIECYPHQLSQAIYNLVFNANDAVENLSEKWIRIEGVDKTDSVEISVTDSGSGVSMENQDKIFDPFFTTKDFGKGTAGLGLSLAKGVVDIHQGKISLDAKCKNTKFIIELPKLRKQLEKKVA